MVKVTKKAGTGELEELFFEKPEDFFEAAQDLSSSYFIDQETIPPEKAQDWGKVFMGLYMFRTLARKDTVVLRNLMEDQDIRYTAGSIEEAWDVYEEVYSKVSEMSQKFQCLTAEIHGDYVQGEGIVVLISYQIDRDKLN